MTPSRAWPHDLAELQREIDIANVAFALRYLQPAGQYDDRVTARVKELCRESIDRAAAE